MMELSDPSCYSVYTQANLRNIRVILRNDMPIFPGYCPSNKLWFFDTSTVVDNSSGCLASPQGPQSGVVYHP